MAFVSRYCNTVIVESKRMDKIVLDWKSSIYLQSQSPYNFVLAVSINLFPCHDNVELIGEYSLMNLKLLSF